MAHTNDSMTRLGVPFTQRRRVLELVESRRFNLVITVVILANAAILGLDTMRGWSANISALLAWGDALCLGIFVCELLLRAYGLRGQFLRDRWCLFDTLVVALALIPSIGPLSVLRTLRVLRVLRIISVAPSMRRVVGGLLAALPGLASIMGIMAILFYVGSVIATGLFAESFPEWFGSLGRSAYTLFQIMTLESWSMGIVRPVMKVYPFAWAFFLPFILVATFTMLNLFIAVIVNAVQQAQQQAIAEEARSAHGERERILAEIARVERSLAELRTTLDPARPTLVARETEASPAALP